MSRYVFAKAAVLDLIAVSEYYERYSVDAAERQMERLRKAFRSLAANPMTGADCGEHVKGLRSFTVRKHVVFYKVRSDGITVVRILSGWRDVKAIDWDAEDS